MQHIYNTDNASAALKADGSVVERASSKVQETLAIDVQSIYDTKNSWQHII